MKTRDKQPEKSIVILLSAVVSVAVLLLLPLPLTNEAIEKVFAASTTLPSNTQATTAINSIDAKTNSNSLVVAQTPLYQAEFGKLIGQTVLNTGGVPQIQESIIENGTMNGVGTNLETWVDTFKSPAIAYGVGQGILTTKDKQRATWIAHDIGRTNDNNGAIIYHGVMFFSSNSTGKLAFLNNLEGLYITEVNDSKQTTKMWEWK
ncbi:MAG: hypothetical protein WCF23_21335 [Candidatus Nitrosopolaris sp.]